MKLQNRVLLPILALIVALMGVSGVLSYRTAEKNLTSSLVNNMKGEAKALVRTIHTLIEDAERDVPRTTTREEIVNFFKGDIHNPQRQKEVSAVLKTVADTYPNFDRMSIYDTEGVTVACSAPSVIGQSFADRDYFKAVKSTREMFTSAPFRSRVNNASVLVVAAPIIQDGKLMGVITANLSLPLFFSKYVEPVQVGDAGYAFVLSAEGFIVLHKQHDLEFNDKLPEKRDYARLAQKGRGADAFVDAKGNMVRVYLEKEPKSGMVAVLRADEADVFSGLTEIRNQTLTVVAVSILLGTLVVFLIIRPVVGAVRAGAAFAEEIAGGKLDSTLAVKRPDELGALAQALRAIPAVLRSIIGSYEQLERDVEQGRLDAQGDASGFSGEYANLVKGTNSVMNRYRMVLDNIPSPVVMLSGEGKAVFLNSQAQQLAGQVYSGKSADRLFSFEDQDSPDSPLRRSLETGRPASGETRAHPGGKTMDVSYSSIPMEDSSGKVVSVLQLITDLTEIKSVQGTIAEVANQALDISDRLAKASEELSSQVDQVSRGANIQRERADSTATAMEKMNATVLEVAHSATEASSQAATTRGKAQAGAVLVEKVTGAIGTVSVVAQDLQKSMQTLGQQAESIGGVMNVISDIADQTNLLALNAAIEAARAGEAGRGFAVVADEVRKLAEKTMNATSEVEQSIKGIQGSVQTSASRFTDAAASVAEAVTLAENSGDALKEILTLAGKSTELVTGIATAAEEQSTTSEGINHSVEEINRIADETATGMEESASAVRRMAGMAQELKYLLDRLKN
ncbi:MAG: methyl-accepting chemotaxis protein [Betaproteobacteria bacterium]|nr:methyl-accepting chemotaxis protein [Betaproteobacteria bacterium]